MQYIALIHKNTDSQPTESDWSQFIDTAISQGVFQGGSELGKRFSIGEKGVFDSTERLGGFMRFDSDDLPALQVLLQAHPVVQHGGTIELIEMPRT